MKLLTFTGPVELQAAAQGKPRKIRIVAYSGGVMTVGGWGQVAVELTGLTLQASTTFLLSHTNDLDSLAAQGAAKVEGGKLTVDATIVPGKAGARLKQLLEAGVSLQASIGCEPSRTSYVSKSNEVKVNGQGVAAGVTVVHAGSLREVSVLPVGADRSTSVSLAASAAGVGSMVFSTWCESIGVVPTDANRGQLEANHAKLFPAPDSPATSAELETVLAGGAAPLLARAMTEGWTSARAKTEALSFIRASRPAVNGAVGGRNEGVLTADHLAAAVMVKAGLTSVAEKSYGPNVLEQSRPMHAMSMVDLCAAALRIDGRTVPNSRNEMIRAGLSTGSLPVALGSSADKILLQIWRESSPTWRSWCAVRSAPNFREQTGLKPTWAGDLEEVADGGEVPHGSYSESTFTWQIGQYAKQYQFGRKTIVNDDLSVFSDVVPGLGKAALRTLSDLVYTTLLANGGSFFHSNHGNLVSGGGTALSATSLGVAVQKLRIQKDPDGNNLDLAPFALVVPPELEVTARGLLQSAELSRISSTDVLPTGNTFQNLAKLEIEPRLSNSAFTNYSTTAWYLFASAADLPMVVGYLDGRESPVVETFGFDSDINRLAMGWRVVHDFGTALGDYRAAQKSAGA